MYLTALLKNLPTVVLAAVVLVAVRGLIDVPALRRLRKISRFEFRISLVALASVLLLGILNGVLVAVVVSLMMLIAVTARPHVAILGRIPGTERYSDIERHPDNEPISGALLFRVESALLYFNVDYVRQILWHRIESSAPLRFVVCDLSSSPYVDVAGAHMLSKLQTDLAARDILLQFVDARSRVRDLLRAEGLEARVGHVGRHESMDQVISEFEHL